MRQVKIFFVVLTCLLFLPGTSQLFAQCEVIEKRQKLMNFNIKVTNAIRKALKENDFATIEAKAKQIAANMDKVPDLFPKGSTSEKSRAKPKIWEEWVSFNEKRIALRTAADALVKAAMAGDKSEVKAKYKALGKACSSCHRSFRGKKKKKK